MKKSINCIKYEGYSVIEVLIDQFDFFQTPNISHQVDDLFPDHDFTHIIFDFKNITYIDSAGIGYLINLRKETIKYGSEIIIVCNDQELLHVMNVSKLLSFFKVNATLNDAIEMVKNF